MPPTPIVPEYRIVFRYTANSFPHKHQALLDCVPSGDLSGFNMNPRGSYAPVGVSDLAAPFFTVIAPFFAPLTTTFDSITLEHRVGTEYVFVWSGATAVVATGSGPNTVAIAEDYVGKDENNATMHAYLYEGIFGLSVKDTGYAALPAAFKAVIDYFYNVGGAAAPDSAFAWRRSRGGYYAQRWLSLVQDSNEKLRRLRKIK